MKVMALFRLGEFDRVASTTMGMLVALLTLGAGSVHAQTSQKTEFNLRMVGHSRVALPWKVTEWFTKEVEARSNGRIKIDLTSSPELGLTGFERIRVLQAGLVDIGDVLPTFVSGELPVLEGQDLPGMYTDFDQMRKAHMAFHPILQKFEERLGGKFLGSYSFEWNYLFSAKPVKAVADMKGKKVRTFSVAIDDFYTALGATPINLPFEEVYTALSRGTVDAVQTASGNALGVKLWEVAPYVLDVGAGAGPAALIVSKRAWNRLPPDLQAMLVKLGEEFTQRGWDDAQNATADAPQRLEAAGFKWTPRADGWKGSIDKAVRESVIPKWSRRAGAEGVKIFNEILTPIVAYRAAP
jgi:TRAP-type C4-dicarboxylate transport system substrate-binding protein